MNPGPASSSSANAGEGGGSGAVVPAMAGSFQHYTVLRREDGTPWELGRGNMGITYKAVDTNLHSAVALKVVNATVINHPNARARFVREARAAAALRHHNVASVYHLGNDGEHFFYAMEFIDGETLDALVRRQGPLPAGTALRLALQAARALAAAARQKLIHRDIKPANLMVVHEDADEHMVVKVIDFGLARPMAGDDEDGSGSLTIHGFVGTPQYASPEQLEERALDERSDIYSLGVTLWFLLTGKPPFTGSLAGICNQHLSKPPPWEQLPATVPEAVRRLLAHTLEKNPENRPQSAVDLRHEIEACLAELHTPAPAAVPGEDVPAGGLIGRLFGRSRPREAAAAPAARPAAGSSPAAGTRDEAGTIFAGRYELVRLVGEGSSGRVFEARDRDDGRTVGVKILRPGFGGGSEEARTRLLDDARQVSAAPHPNLVELFRLECPPAPDETLPAYLIEEFLRGFNLRDLLAARSGALPVAECLRLLGQAAAAVDHAVRLRLERLETGIHQIHLHFPSPDAPARRALLGMSMEEWPRWSLKVEPLGLGHHAQESGTWAGEVTLLPGVARPPAATDGDALAGTYLHALARLTCELLGGQAAGTAKYVSLPTLNESGNTVLARALSGEGAGSGSAQEFYRAFANAAGFDADPLAPAVVDASAQVTPVRRAAADDSSVARTRTRSVVPARGPKTLHEEDAEESPGIPAFWSGEDRPPTSPASPHDPWQDSQLARLLEEEEKAKLVDPSSVGYALTIGAMIGLVLLMAVLGGLVWYRGFRRVPPEPRAATASQNTGKRTGTPATRKPAVAGATPRRAISATPPPLMESQVARAAAAIPPPAQPASPPEISPRRLLDPTPRFNDKTVAVQIRSEPAGAEVFLKGASLGQTPLKATLPPGDYEFAAHYKDWPEVRQTVHLDAQQDETSTDIRLMSPGRLPFTADGSVYPMDSARRRWHERRHAAAVPAAPAENPRSPRVPLPVARRAVPVPEPFLKPGDSPAAQSPADLSAPAD